MKMKYGPGVTTELVVRINSSTIRRVAVGLLFLDLVVVLLHVVPTLMGHGGRLFDLDAEANIPTWYSSAKLFLLAQALAVLALVLSRRSRLDAAPFLFLAALALFLSLDETATLHERLARHFETALTGAARSDLEFTRTGYWMLALGPMLAAALAVGIWLMTKRLKIPRHVAVRGLLGVAVFFFSATGIEILSNFTITPILNLVQVAVEEGGEMIGVTLVIWSLLDLLAAKLEPAPLAASADEGQWVLPLTA